MTFIRLSDLIAQYNSQSFGERSKSDVLFDHLIKQLENKKMIVTSPNQDNSEYKPENENSRQRANSKAIASEFPSFLTAIYTLETSYREQHGTFTSNFDSLDGFGGGLISHSKFFSYFVNNATESTFTAQAAVLKPFGQVTVEDYATVNQDGQRIATNNLFQYVPSWEGYDPSAPQK
jgi:hypothetical protein